MPRSVWSLLPVLCVSAVAACDSSHLAAPRDASTPGRPTIHRDVVAGTFSLPTPLNNDSGAVLPAMSTGVTVPQHMLHFVTVSNTITVSENPEAVYLNPPASAMPAIGATIGPLGWLDPGGFIHFYVVVGDDGNPTLHPLSGSAAAAVQTDTMEKYSTSTITVARSELAAGGSCNSSDMSCQCPSGPCNVWAAGYYSFTGTEQLSVTEPSQPAIALSASPDTVTSGNSIDFLITLTPSAWGSHTFPSNNQVWAFNGTTQCRWANHCTFTPPASGTMVYTANVNGLDVTDSVAVVVQ